MRLFTVHLPALTGPQKALEGAVFVRDGFHFWAFLLGVFWCLWRGLWVAAIAVLLAAAALYGIGRALHVAPGTQLLMQLVLALLVGLEAGNLQRFGLRRRGYGWRVGRGALPQRGRGHLFPSRRRQSARGDDRRSAHTARPGGRPPQG